MVITAPLPSPEARKKPGGRYAEVCWESLISWNFFYPPGNPLLNNHGAEARRGFLFNSEIFRHKKSAREVQGVFQACPNPCPLRLEKTPNY